MKSYPMVIVVLLGAMLAGAARADITYVCTYGQKERLITVMYADQATRLPCEVRYTKEGATEVLWHATTQAGYCEEKAQGLVQQHLEWGWRCGGGTQGGTPLMGTSAVPDQNAIADYRRDAHIAQGISLSGLFRLEVASYHAEHGRFPTSIEELGHRREDMRTSSHFRDLRIGEEGTILIQGNEGAGADTVIALRPRMALGGMTMEWDCFVNVETGSALSCEYEPQLRF